MKKIINLLMLTTILMSQMTFGLTAFAVEIDTKESSEVVTENLTEDVTEETSSTEIDKDAVQEVPELKIENFNLDKSTSADDATPRGSTMDVELSYYNNAIHFPLGSTETTKKRIMDDISTVTIDGKVVGPEEYVIEFIDDKMNYDVYNTSHPVPVTFIFKDKKNLANTKSVTANAGVAFESSIEFKAGQFVGAYSLHTDDSEWTISGNSGLGSRDNVFSTGLANKVFYRIDTFRKVGSNPIVITEDADPFRSFTAQGHEKVGTVLDRWNKDTSVKEGDIIRTWTDMSNKGDSFLRVNKDINGSYASTTEDYPDDRGYAYYEVTKEGFVPFKGTALEVVQQDIQQSSTDEQLDKIAKNSFKEVPSNYEVNGFTEYPSRAKLGISKGYISVTETVPKTNQKLERIYEAPFNVIEDQMNITLKENNAFLGVEANTLKASNYVSGIYFGNTSQASGYFTSEFIELPNTNLVGAQKAKIKVYEKSNPNNFVIEESTTNVLWGNTLATTTKTNSSLYESSVSMLDVSGKPSLRASEGAGLSTSNLSTEPNLSVYRNNDTTKLYEAKTTTKSQTPKKLMETWQTDLNKFNLVYGDVVSYSVPGEKGNTTLAARSEKAVKETVGFDSAYYELTKNGYRLMRANQFTVNSTVPKFDVGTSLEDMNKTATSRLNFPAGATSSDYRIEYASVDTSTPGVKTTKMNVYEKLTTGGEFMTTYDVEYNVLQDNTMSIELKEQNAFLGVDASTITAKNYLSKVYFGDRAQSNTYFEAEFVELPNTNLVGKQTAKIKVYEKSNPSNFVIEESTTNVLWGNNIGAYRKSDSTSFDSSVSMLEVGGKPTLRANEGSGLSTHSSLNTEPNLSVYRKNDTSKLYEAKTKTKSQTAQKLMETWQSEFNNYKLEYGDVVSYTVPSQKGANTVTARSEKLVKETVGFNSAYYELTKTGYRLMRANQFTVNSTVPKFDVGTSLEEMNKTATSRLNLPAGATANDYRIEYASVDTATPGVKTTKMNVYEKLTTGGEFMTTYDVTYEVVKVLEPLKVELQEVSIPVGTKVEWLDANEYVKEVRLGDKKLNASEYTARFVKNPDTNLVSTNTKTGEVKKQSTQITIETKETKQVQTEETQTMIIWGQSITTKSSSESFTMSSVSLLENKGKPYLIANQGIGYSGSGMQYDPSISLYRGNMSNGLIKDGANAGVNTTSILTQHKWNEELSQLDVAYGDVFGYRVKRANGTNYLGKKTWATRNEVPTLETEGFEDAYYELTKDGYRLMRFNQFTVKDAVPSFEIGTTKEEMDNVAKNQLNLPVGADSKNYQIEYASVDTTTSGTKTTKMNVYETLATGGKFMTTYDVQYNVSSVLTEKYVDDSGKELKTETQSLGNGQAYQPKPENYATIDGELYIYQGWLTSSQTAGKDNPKEGNPPAVSSTTTYQYVYTKANNMINVTIPTEMIFGTYKDGSSTISSSGNNVVKNNSKDVKTEVIMGEFKKEKSSVTLLKSSDSNPIVLKDKKARLNLTADNKTVISSLNESDKDKVIKELAPESETTLGMTGKYYGDLSNPQKVQYKMILKFKVKP